jgi:hypothetical protein
METRLKRLEKRRVLEAVQLIFECARAASLDDVARFTVTGLELEQKPEPDEEDELQLWGHLGIPLEAVRVAEAAPGRRWAVALGDMLFDKRGLRDYMRRHYPKTAARLYGQRGAGRG